MKVCVITDNELIYNSFLEIIKSDNYKNYEFDFYCSPGNQIFAGKGIPIIDLKRQDDAFFSLYSLFLSLHATQIFPAQMVENNLCINVHPGYNPYNRGWYPQVFGILNKEPVGVTIHRMDSQLDHGPILFQEKVPIYPTDTSYDVYLRIQELEATMLKKHLPAILRGDYIEQVMCEEGSIHYKKDFEALCKIDLNKKATYGEVIDHLRAMTFKGYRNAFFITETGEKVYIEVKLT